MKKIIIAFFLAFIFSFNTFADWKDEVNNDKLKLIETKWEEYVNIYWFTKVEINKSWEYILHYSKSQYDLLLKHYWWKKILWFDPENNWDIKLNYNIEIEWNIVKVTILKDNLEFIIKKYIQTNSFPFWWKLDIRDEFLANSVWSSSFLDSFVFDNYEIFYNNYLNYYFYNRWDILWIFQEVIDKCSDQSCPKLKDNLLYIQDNNLSVFLRYTNNKQRIDLENSKYVIFNLNNKKDLEILKNIIFDNFYWGLWEGVYDIIDKNDFVLYDTDNDVILKISTDKDFHLYGEINNHHQSISIDKYNNKIELNHEWEDITDEIDKKFIYILNWNTYINVSIIYDHLNLNSNFKELSFYVDWYDNNLKNVWNFYKNFTDVYNKNILPLASQIKSPKNISTNPALISVNFILALLYLLAFYFTTQLFNSYFEELSTKNKWNAKLSKISIKYTKLPFETWYNYLIKISKEKKIPKLRLYVNKIRNFTIKYEHKIYIILWFLGLWIIGQIVVDDFDILSLKWWFTIIIMMLILAFITVFKDLLLYLYNKKESKEKLKLENIPLGFIFAGIVAISWRWIWLIPWVMFGSVIKLNAKSNITERKTTKPKLLFKILLIVFWVWLLCWLLTIPFDSSSFIYKFLIVAYFGLINDVFFALLPFGMLWGIYILKDKKLKVKWFIFTFIIFFFLLHTIMNSEWDLDKLLEFDGNFSVLVWILFFWMLITGGLYYMNSKKIISK